MLMGILSSCHNESTELRISENDLVFNELAGTWDEGIPLGNGMLGKLIWQKDGNLRFALDRADLWDLRPVNNLSLPQFSFNWVQEQVANNTYEAVQDLFDKPYDQMPAPSKIPAAALEFDISDLGEIRVVRLDILNALCRVEWKNGAILEAFVHAENQTGWFRFTNIPENLIPRLIPPEYQKQSESIVDSPVTGQDLQRLDYKQGKIIVDDQKLIYRQQGWDDFEYEVAVNWRNTGSSLTGVWSISSSFSYESGKKPAGLLVSSQLNDTNFEQSLNIHRKWWLSFWNKSSVQLPDSILEKQYYMELYKFGSAARPDTPPVSLQAVWTADNGKLPPWKGDFHHDLNTQLSYWPAYTGNHLDLEIGFLNWLWEHKCTFEEYTRTYFGTSGLNVPGVTTLTGQPMGGWIQYSFGPTVASWLGHHFYLHWKYSKDEVFLKERAYPWLKDVAVYLDEISVKDKKGMRKLPISSSPEINSNSIDAWFNETTNFDLGLIRWNFEKAAELAKVLGLDDDAKKWQSILHEWPDDFALDENSGGLAIAPGYPYLESHRHFSHLIPWHPIGIIDWSYGPEDRHIIKATLSDMERVGSNRWTGYSFSWLGNLYARAFMGEKAAKTLRIFARNFCLPNSFHVNGEQHNRGYSSFKYRPFTLEGNFAFASAIQNMLIQSHTGIVQIFPAIPPEWSNVSFTSLRTEGAFVISAQKKCGKVDKVEIFSEKGGILKLLNPFEMAPYSIKSSWNGPLKSNDKILAIEFPENGEIILSVKD